MIKVQPAVTQMNNGHLAPILEGRTDIQVYGYSCRQTENAIPLVYGANKNRGGTIYVTSTKDSTKKAALIPFKVSESISYQLEFGDEYIRFYRNHSPILKNGAVYEIVSPYKYEDLFDNKGLFQIDYVQSFDVFYLTHEKYIIKKLSRYGETDWRFSDVILKNGPWGERNIDSLKKIGSTAATGNTTLNAFTGTYLQPYFETNDVGVGNGYPMFKFYLNGTPFPADQQYMGLSGNTCASYIADALNGCQTDLVAVNEHDNQLRVVAEHNYTNYAEKTFTIEIYNVTGHILVATKTYTFSPSGQSYHEVFTRDMVGRSIRIHDDRITEVWYSGRTGISTGTIIYSDGKYYKAVSSGTCGNVKPIHTAGIESDGGVSWRYVSDGYGIVRITSYISPYSVGGVVEKELLHTTTADEYYSSQWELSFIGEDGIYPSSVCFFKDRLTFGINSSEGHKIVFSKTGDYENFEDITAGQVLADNAITLNVLSDMNNINWLCPSDNLFVGTDGGVISIEPMTNNEVFGPNNIFYHEITNIGTCKIKPIRIGDDILYLGRLTKDVYAIAYNFQSDSYEPDEVSLSAYDLLDAGITSWALQYEPNRIVWMVRRDGKLVGFTYNKKQQVRAFHLHSTQGEFESVSCIPSPDGTQDEIWFITKRNYGTNSSERCIEYMHNGIPLGIPFDKQANHKLLHEYILKNCVYLDSAKVYSLSPASDTLTGLGHLEGLTVGVIADGVYVGTKTVSSGTITLNSSATNVVVGLPYTTIVEPMPINVDMPNGSGQARSQRINQVIVRLYRTASFEYSWGKEWHPAPVKDYDKLALMSGDLLLSWGDSNTEIKLNQEDIVNSTGSRMLFRQTEPLPFYFVCFYPQLEVSNG